MTTSHDIAVQRERLCVALSLPVPLTSMCELYRTAADRIQDLESRLAVLTAWLESRGLPAEWTGPLDAWGWVLLADVWIDSDVIGWSAGDGVDADEQRADGAWVRWDRATPEQRAAALALR